MLGRQVIDGQMVYSAATLLGCQCLHLTSGNYREAPQPAIAVKQTKGPSAISNGLTLSSQWHRIYTL